MKTIALLLTFLALTMAACSGSTANLDKSVPPPNIESPTPIPTAFPEPKNGEYPGKGVITKLKPSSVELKHDEIVGVMPPMQMEFNVRDAAVLKGLKVGDKVDFVLEYKDRAETIVKIEKSK